MIHLCECKELVRVLIFRAPEVDTFDANVFPNKSIEDINPTQKLVEKAKDLVHDLNAKRLLRHLRILWTHPTAAEIYFPNVEALNAFRRWRAAHPELPEYLKDEAKAEDSSGKQ